jgi:hypothetical protein
MRMKDGFRGGGRRRRRRMMMRRIKNRFLGVMVGGSGVMMRRVER